ncbi:hypothetical protein BgiBS90_012951, partial [Biomphalaria glabrata]
LPLEFDTHYLVVIAAECLEDYKLNNETLKRLPLEFDTHYLVVIAAECLEDYKLNNETLKRQVKHK